MCSILKGNIEIGFDVDEEGNTCLIWGILDKFTSSPHQRPSLPVFEASDLWTVKYIIYKSEAYYLQKRSLLFTKVKFIIYNNKNVLCSPAFLKLSTE